MFYAVFLFEFEVHAVIPSSWLQNDKKVMAKYMYSGIKQHQKHVCFYNESFENIIETNGELVQPNFNLPFSGCFPCAEGIFRCRIFNFFRKYTDSRQFFICVFTYS